MKQAAPTTHGSLSPNMKWFGLIVAAIIVALATFTIGKAVWDNYQEDLAKERAAIAAAEQARQRQISSYITNPQTLPKTWGEVEVLQGTLNINDQTMSTLTVAWLKTRKKEGVLKLEEIDKYKNRGTNTKGMEAEYNIIAVEYNKGIKTLSQDVFEEKTSWKVQPSTGIYMPELIPHMATF